MKTMWKCNACGYRFIPNYEEYSCPKCRSNNTIPNEQRLEELKNKNITTEKNYEYYKGNAYHFTDIENYQAVKNRKHIKITGVIEGKPLIKNSRYSDHYRIYTYFTFSGITARYWGPLLVQEGDEVTIWGLKRKTRLEADKIETSKQVYETGYFF